MRHQDIATTMRYYVDHEADYEADDLWDNYQPDETINNIVNSVLSFGPATGAREKPQALTS